VTLPLDGVRVLDLTRNLAGPYAAMILAELGADVVKVESPDGDDTRQWGPPFWDGEGPVFLAANRNKRSIVLDLRTDEARAAMERLCRRSDVLLESFRPDALERLGYGYAWARSVNPGVLYCSVTPYGDGGPLRDRPGYDPLIQAFSGIMSVTGEPDRAPVRVGVSVIDMGTGMWAAMSVLAALLQRKRDGRGRRIVTSLYETGLAWMSYHLASYWGAG
jgi:formyl-CoA transferase/CoA:oxalate CoA-transferase